MGKGATVPRLVIHQREGAMKILRRCPGSSQAGRAITTSFIFNYFLFILSYKLRSDCLRYRLQISPTVLTTTQIESPDNLSCPSISALSSPIIATRPPSLCFRWQPFHNHALYRRMQSLSITHQSCFRYQELDTCQCMRSANPSSTQKILKQISLMQCSNVLGNPTARV